MKMKCRSGFVSNSSSSSFIIGIANATQAGRSDLGVPFYPQDIQYSKWNGAYFSFNDSMDYALVRHLGEGNYRLRIESFSGLEVSCIAKEGDKIVYVDGRGPDGDEYFSIYNEEGDWIDIDYDNIDLEDFDKKDQEKYELILSLNGEAYYGAGRNG